MSLKNRSFLKLLDYTPAEIEELPAVALGDVALDGVGQRIHTGGGGQTLGHGGHLP